MSGTRHKNYCNFSRAQDELLIELVARQPALYDPAHGNYKDTSARDLIWVEIAGTLDEKDDDCKTRWRSIRDLYNKKRRGGQLAPGFVASAKCKWDYVEQLSFLENVGSYKRVNSKLKIEEKSDPDEINEAKQVQETWFEIDDIEDVQPSALKRNYVRLDEMNLNYKAEHEPLGENSDCYRLVREALMNRVREDDPVQLFFDSMARTVQRFPSHMQAEAKMQVCQVITDFERRAVEELKESSDTNGDGRRRKRKDNKI